MMKKEYMKPVMTCTDLQAAQHLLANSLPISGDKVNEGWVKESQDWDIFGSEDVTED